ncbi:MAG: SDR family NAD(P)-dependent oxidoreductase [Leucobacter sp.]
MSKRFEGRSFVITGGYGGIGAAQCVALGEEGATVWVAGRDSQKAEAIALEVSSAGGEGRTFPLDVADPSSWEGLAARVGEHGDGLLHGLVNNAGISHRVGVTNTTVDNWHRVLDTNLSGIFYGMKFLQPALAAAGSASIVNTSSVWGLIGYMSASYTATKWAVRGLTKTASAEFAEFGIRVNSIHPGPIETPLMWQQGDTDFINATLRTVPAQRTCEPSELANTVLYLLSDQAAYITGSEIAVDGGLTAAGLSYRILADAKPRSAEAA